MPYTINDHCHRLAAWAASSSASASPVCRFKVEKGVAILEASGFNSGFAAPDQLPSPQDADSEHRKWRASVIANAHNVDLEFSHGIAAKLINCYLKVRFVCAGHHNHENVKCLHPPIDEVLLQELASQNYGGNARQWRAFRQKRWSKFDSDTYESVIKLIRQSLPANQSLWEIEQHWSGHQKARPKLVAMP